MSEPFYKSAKSLIDRLLKRTEKQTVPEVKSLIEEMPEGAPPDHIRGQARERGELWSMIRIVQAAVVGNLILAGLFLMVDQSARSRPLQVLASEGDLDDQVQRYFAQTGEAAPITDDVCMFVVSVLSIKHGVSPAGAPMLPLLQSLVAKEIYSDAASTIARNLNAVKMQQMTQSFVPESITIIDYNKKAQTIALAVTGKIAQQTEKMRRGGVMAKSIEYRARINLLIVPKNEKNQMGFYMPNSLKEVFGTSEAAKFDQEMEDLRERLRGGK